MRISYAVFFLIKKIYLKRKGEKQEQKEKKEDLQKRSTSEMGEKILMDEGAVMALLDRRGGDARGRNFALGRVVVSVENLRAFPRDDDPVALVEIGDLLRQRRERERIRAQVGLALSITHDERRAEARADQEVRVLTKGDGEREGAAELRQHGLHRVLPRQARLDPLRHEVSAAPVKIGR